MATTRIISMHVNQGKTIADCLTDRIDYSKNPDKTQGGELISAYQCDPKTADAEFLYSKRQYQTVTGREQRHDVIAYQVRQSFKPGEITPEEANRVGYPWYTEDAFIEVSDEVAAFLEEDKRLQINYAQYIRDNKAFYSLDAGDGIEAEALNLPEQPDEMLERMELERLLKEALAQLTPAQRRRVLAHFVEGRSQLEIAASEGVVKSTVSEAISRGRKKLRNFLKKFR